MSSKKLSVDGNTILSHESFKSIRVPLIDLIAKCSIWVAADQVSPTAIYPTVKRGAPKDKGKIIDGIRIDDNTYANRAIKVAVNKSIKFENYEVCHIWPDTTYDERYHTLLQNLVMIPRLLAGLSDHYQDVVDVLKYRAWELYNWHPEDQEAPSKPDYYPSDWGTAVPDLNNQSNNEDPISLEEYLEELDYEEDKVECEIEKLKKRVPRWKQKPDQINSRILSLYMRMSNGASSRVTHNQLKEQFETLYDDPFETNYAQMKFFGLKNHGKVFTEHSDGTISLWYPIAGFIKDIYR